MKPLDQDSKIVNADSANTEPQATEATSPRLPAPAPSPGPGRPRNKPVASTHVAITDIPASVKNLDATLQAGLQESLATLRLTMRFCREMMESCGEFPVVTININTLAGLESMTEKAATNINTVLEAKSWSPVATAA